SLASLVTPFTSQHSTPERSGPPHPPEGHLPYLASIWANCCTVSAPIRSTSPLRAWMSSRLMPPLDVALGAGADASVLRAADAAAGTGFFPFCFVVVLTFSGVMV